MIPIRSQFLSVTEILHRNSREIHCTKNSGNLETGVNGTEIFWKGVRKI